MNDALVVQIGLQAMLAAAKLAAPVLLTTLAVGVLIGLLQSVTQVQEPTVTFVPKFVAVGVVLLVAGNWMLGELVTFTESMFRMVPDLVRS
jgi:flagellar biosynthetic protein FliQ